MKPNQIDAIKHPERMGPLGDQPDHPRRRLPETDEPTPVEEQAEISDREQLTTQE